ncbi:hypothetical protein TYRP_012109 [Tyrophagus putrescentiae]|nr:hypothetical protein TYRP_012109 [Tyrophagus putrescentiae]
MKSFVAIFLLFALVASVYCNYGGYGGHGGYGYYGPKAWSGPEYKGKGYTFVSHSSSGPTGHGPVIYGVHGGGYGGGYGGYKG